MDPLSIAAGVAGVGTLVVKLFKEVAEFWIDVSRVDRTILEFVQETNTAQRTVNNITTTFCSIRNDLRRSSASIIDENAIINFSDIKTLLDDIYGTLNRLDAEVHKIGDSKTVMARQIAKALREPNITDLRGQLREYNQMLNMSFHTVSLRMQVTNQAANQASHSDTKDEVRKLRKELQGLRMEFQSSSEANVFEPQEETLQEEQARVRPVVRNWLNSTLQMVDDIERATTYEPDLESQAEKEENRSGSHRDLLRRVSGSQGRMRSRTQGEDNESARSTDCIQRNPREDDSAYGSEPSRRRPIFDEGAFSISRLRDTINECNIFVALYVRDENYAEAQKYQERAIKYYEELEKSHHIRFKDKPQMMHALADLHVKEDEFDIALKIMLDLHESTDKGTETYWNVCYSTALIFEKRNDQEKEDRDMAKGFAQEALVEGERLFPIDDDRIIWSLEMLARIFENDGDKAFATTFRKDAEKHRAWKTFFGKNPKLRDDLVNSGVPPLIYAASCGLVDTVSSLLEDMPQAREVRDSTEATALICAAEHKNLEIVEMLLSKRARVDAVDTHRDTALHRAQRVPPPSFQERHPDQNWHILARDITRLLLENGADILAQNSDEETALHLAAQFGNCEVIPVFLELNRSLLRIADDDGNLPQHTAAEKQHNAVVKALLKHGADINAVDRSDQDMMKIAKSTQYGNREIQRTLTNWKNSRPKNSMMSMASKRSDQLSITMSSKRSIFSNPFKRQPGG